MDVEGKKSGASPEDYFSSLEERLETGMEKLALELATEYYTLLIRNIRTNRFSFKLKPNTLQKRRAKGNTSALPLVDTGDLVGAIIVEEATVKIKNGIHHSGLEYIELASILEFGRLDKGIKPFNVWQRTWEEFEPSARKRIDDFVSSL